MCLNKLEKAFDLEHTAHIRLLAIHVQAFAGQEIENELTSVVAEHKRKLQLVTDASNHRDNLLQERVQQILEKTHDSQQDDADFRSILQQYKFVIAVFYNTISDTPLMTKAVE